ncbi:hypothetical protein BAUCODRAFT_294961 [Baudoinia panamericana UAMH 10762]|uniref:Uncharacterized protein n=1 Tax=Baudoinia panamericana (strain UAMH 10762) TaxID=717646 RepID=M2N1N0_BAUPA|nr:uncharacterized protein BAUCODRAFT_294961 [Baudoinia panamericana UAMH 10762]EMC92530.1 hypothetical protein BAUCODRAFT_294961 [Baudoinia panamericana UAMH 10762]
MHVVTFTTLVLHTLTLRNLVACALFEDLRTAATRGPLPSYELSDSDQVALLPSPTVPAILERDATTQSVCGYWSTSTIACAYSSTCVVTQLAGGTQFAGCISSLFTETIYTSGLDYYSWAYSSICPTSYHCCQPGAPYAKMVVFTQGPSPTYLAYCDITSGTRTFSASARASLSQLGTGGTAFSTATSTSVSLTTSMMGASTTVPAPSPIVSSNPTALSTSTAASSSAASGTISTPVSSTTASTAATTSSDSDNNQLSKAEQIGIGVGVPLGVAVIGLLGKLLLAKRK